MKQGFLVFLAGLILASCGVEYDLSKPITIKFEEGFSEEEKADVEEGLALWQDVAPRINFVRAEDGDQTLKVVYDESVCDDHHAAEWSHVGVMALCPKKDPCRNRFLSVVGHEFGHALGLEHSEDESSIMYARAQACHADYPEYIPTRRPTEEDFLMLHLLHPELSLEDTPFPKANP